VLGEGQFGIRREKGTEDATGMLRTSEWTLDIDEELFACFIYWQRAFDCVKWAKLRLILKETGVDWGERRLISKLHKDQCVEADWTKGREEVWRLEEKLEKDVVYHRFYSNYTANALHWRGWSVLKMRKNNSHCEICRWPELLAKERKMLRDTIDWLI
jgi:hypothetical protein